MNTSTVHPSDQPVKQLRPTLAKSRTALKAAGLRPVGQLDALFPSYDPEKFLSTFDRCALSELQIKKLILDPKCGMAFPSYDPEKFVDWFYRNEIRIFSKTFLGTRRLHRWFGLFRLILAVERKEAGR